MDGARGLKALENWAKKVTDGYNGVHVKDMSTSFRDGLAFCAIIHHYYPDFIDYASLSKENILHNNSLAFRVAETQLGVPALLDAEDMVSFNVPDRLSIITYLSQLHNCFENQNKFNKVRPAVKRVLKDEPSSPLTKSPLSESKNSTPRSHEICQKCKHRVFILERLIVSSKLYHRSCFRCSKCDAILNPGAYTESDSNDTFECILCPRDDKKEKVKLPSPTIQEPTICEESINGTDPPSQEESSSRLSPLPTRESPTLSSSFLKARGDFLKKSIDKESDDQEASLSSESLSSDDEPEDLDSGFKDESLSEDVSHKLPQASNSENNNSESQKPMPFILTKSRQSDDSKQEPYQSVFSREITNILSLKPTSPGSISPKPLHRSKSPLGFTSNNISRSELPVIRSGISLPATPLKSSVSSASDAEDKHRRNSFESNTPDSKTHDNADNSEDSRVNVLSSESVEDSNVILRNSERSEEKAESRMSVREMVLLREASIENEKLSVGNYMNSTPPSDLQETTSSPVSEKAAEESTSEDVATEVEINLDDSLKNEDVQDDSVQELEPEIEPPKSLDESSDMCEEVNTDITESTNDHVTPKAEHLEPEKVDVPEVEHEVEVETELEKEEVYPDDLNPFGDEEDDVKDNTTNSVLYPVSLNPFGDSDEEDTNVSASNRTESYDESLNPFADDDDPNSQSIKTPPPRPPLPSVLKKSPTDSIRSSAKKRPAPRPPPPHVKELFLNTSCRSDSSLSNVSSPSSINSASPKVPRSKRPPPPPPPASPLIRGHDSGKASLERPVSSPCPASPNADRKSISSSDSSGSHWKKKKRPAPSVPVAPRREVKKIPISEIQAEMKEIEQKQNELESHGRELEEVIRVREKERRIEPTLEEEECILQLFELVNEKNALFRRQAELMHIKRSQRLEEEQVELEFQIRSLMIKPATKKTDEDKAREEKLIKQLIDVVDQRNEIISSIEMERRREQGEDESIQEQMEAKTGDLPITAELNEKKKKKKKKKKTKEEKQKAKEEKLKALEKQDALDPSQKKFTLKRKWF